MRSKWERSLIIFIPPFHRAPQIKRKGNPLPSQRAHHWNFRGERSDLRCCGGRVFCVSTPQCSGGGGLFTRWDMEGKTSTGRLGQNILKRSVISSVNLSPWSCVNPASWLPLTCKESFTQPIILKCTIQRFSFSTKGILFRCPVPHLNSKRSSLRS